MNDKALLLGHAGFTAAMVGLMWSVQMVVYPQFRSVPADAFASYVTDHSTRIVWALAVFAPIEVLLALLVFTQQPDGVPRWLAFVAGAFLVVGWVATGAWYAPLHGRLQNDGYDLDRINLLINTNWLRTALWSVRGVLALAMVWRSWP